MPQYSIDQDGVITGADFTSSPNHDARPEGATISMIVIHNISLPPGEYGGPGITELFTNKLDPAAHPYYATIHELRVSAHFLIRRDGALQQFVPCEARAWHAGVSTWQGQERCNDFSIGIELEGSDSEAFTPAQYIVLTALAESLCKHYPIRDIVGHSDIAPGRKTDPGPHFDWQRLAQLKASSAQNPTKSV
ncbi:1,6-anhydro-N-acetylmuramyl-L-alanine amidase AmpD [Methylobacillus caricis]|nr:1,6-anhydro-N-acetylmuramyl-L-alanine amidase AmpD [Methylobacillus caricis]MCB5188358.1 1,6-anhydro-N-acetylmuramyl-L-alanine amidase AmpD [Methylobacillus caricis]